jgi:hypothetical protein
MSVDRSITFEIFVEKKGISDCLKLFFSDHWTPYNEDREITYLPVGITDSSHIAITNDMAVFYKTVEEKEKLKEFFLVHFWDINHEEAHTLLIYPEKEDERYNRFKLLWSLGAAKKLKGSQRQTDFSHYLEKIVPVLEKNNFLFDSITCQDFG